MIMRDSLQSTVLSMAGTVPPVAEPMDARLIKVYVKEWDQTENQRAPPGLTETYLVRLK